MTINGNNVNETMDFLIEKFKAGYKFVTFDHFNGNDRNSMLCFKDYHSMQKHLEKTFEWYIPIVNILNELDPRKYGPRYKLNEGVLEQQLLSSTIKRHFYYPDVKNDLMKGKLCFVLTKRIVKDEEILNYGIYKHIDHTVNGPGSSHTVRLEGAFNEISSAEKVFAKITSTLADPPVQTSPDYYLIAHYRNVALKQDREGFPVNASGVIVKSARTIYNDELCRPAYNIVDHAEPCLSELQPMYVKYNFYKEKLEYFDGTLTRVNAGDKIPYVPYWRFSIAGVEKSDCLNQSAISAKTEQDNRRQIKIQ